MRLLPIAALGAALSALAPVTALAAGETASTLQSVSALSVPESGVAPVESDRQPLTTRNRLASPPRPGFNFSLNAELLPVSYVRNQLTARFGAWPSPSMGFLISTPVLGKDVFLLEEHRELAGVATTRCNGTMVRVGAACIAGGKLAGNVEPFATREWVNEQRGGLRLGHSSLYAGLAAFFKATNYGVVDIVGGGYGLELLPDFYKRSSPFGHVYYYPNVNNEDPYVNPRTNAHEQLRLGMVRYEIGIARKLGRGRQYVKVALDGSSAWRLVNYPNNSNNLKIVLGSGLRF